IGLGDGGSGGDPNNRAQQGTSLLGKMLRLDVDRELPYSIPSDSPFISDNNIADEIWAMGLRNPWRFSFDRQTGDMYIGDVGQNAFEEIDFQAADSTGGENYGWRCYEGNAPFNTGGCASQNEYVSPIHTYDRDLGFSVTGGYVYRGTHFPILMGHYLFSDYVTQRMWSLKRDASDVWQSFYLGMAPGQISTFGENSQGELFIASYKDGVIYQILEDTTPSIQLRKTVSLDQTCQGAGQTSLTVMGSGTLPIVTVTYCYQIENVGVITLTHHTLTDNQLGLLLDDTGYLLTPGAQYVYSRTVALSQTTVNVATWQATNGVITATSTSTATVTFFATNSTLYLPVILK
ncbi:MAG: PQQ-dependent sugar dehydrogenase, partial [Chloroflexota bacterium]